MFTWRLFAFSKFLDFSADFCRIFQRNCEGLFADFVDFLEFSLRVLVLAFSSDVLNFWAAFSKIFRRFLQVFRVKCP